MQLKDKKVTVVGLKKTGLALAGFLVKKGAIVTVSDSASEEKVGEYAEKVRAVGAVLELGKHEIKTFEDADLIVMSPGVPHTIEPVKRAEEKGVEVIGEIELASMFIKEPIVAVTGTNGKTTVTTLIGKMLEACNQKVFVGGNIGDPLIGYVDREEKADAVVVEVSSFQLDTIKNFKPHVGVLLNVTEDHMDRYTNFEQYAQSKARVFENQGEENFAILNCTDEFVKKICAGLKGKLCCFGGSEETQECSIKNIHCKAPANKSAIDFLFSGFSVGTIDFKDIKIIGGHNYENAAAAALATLCMGGKFEGIKKTLAEFPGLSDRIEFVDEINGVKFYDDSKATNVDAVKRALEAFDDGVVLVLGGRDKGGSFEELAEEIQKKCIRVIAIGEAKEKIARVLDGTVEINFADTMKDAVDKGFEILKTSGSVLLSPACASFDMYSSYHERGNDFKNAVSNLRGRQ